MIATFVFPFSTVASGMRRWPLSNNLCQFNGFIFPLWTTVSLWTLALTSINRYFCVVKPQQYSVFFTKRKTVLSILSVWIFQFFFSVSIVFSSHAFYRWQPNGLFYKAHYQDEDAEDLVYIGITCISFLSILVMLLGYGRVCSVVRQHNRAIVPSLQHAGNSQGAIRAQEIKNCRILFAAVFGYCISWIPITAVLFCESAFEVSIPAVAEAIPTLCYSTSAWINPIIYGVMNRAMRREFRNTLLCRNGG